MWLTFKTALIIVTIVGVTGMKYVLKNEIIVEIDTPENPRLIKFQVHFEDAETREILLSGPGVSVFRANLVKDEIEQGKGKNKSSDFGEGAPPKIPDTIVMKVANHHVKGNHLLFQVNEILAYNFMDKDKYKFAVPNARRTFLEKFLSTLFTSRQVPTEYRDPNNDTTITKAGLRLPDIYFFKKVHAFDVGGKLSKVTRRQKCWTFGMEALGHSLVRECCNRESPIDLVITLGFTIQLLRYMMYFQLINLIHNDLKPDNVLLYPEDSTKIVIIDFGGARFPGSILNDGDVCGSPTYFPYIRHIDEHFKPNFHSEAETLSMVLYEIISGKLLSWTDLIHSELPQMVEAKLNFPEEMKRLPYRANDDAYVAVTDLLIGMLQEARDRKNEKFDFEKYKTGFEEILEKVQRGDYYRCRLCELYEPHSGNCPKLPPRDRKYV